MTGPQEHLSPEDEADLVALTDGCLSGDRLAETQARVAADPELAEALQCQWAALAKLAAAAVPAPLELRLRVEELKASRPRRRRTAPAAALALAATVIAFLVLTGGRGPAVDDVLAVALRPATASAATTESFEGIRFPHYERWRATGTRTDVVDDRRVRTVFYERDGRTIAYAIVSGPALDDAGALRTVRGGDGIVAVTWTRDGRTCVIAASGVDASVLAKLAVW